MSSRIRSYLALFCSALLGILLTITSYLGSSLLRFDFDTSAAFVSTRLWFPLALLLTLRFVCYVHYELHHRPLRYASTRDALVILKAHGLSSLAFMTVVGFLRVPNFPRSVFIIELLLSLILAGAIRLAARIISESRNLSSNETGSIKDVIVLGASISGQLLVKTLLAEQKSNFRPVAIFDDNSLLLGSKIHGVPVVGQISQLESWLETNFRKRSKNPCTLLANSSDLSEARVTFLRSICPKYGITFQLMRTFEEQILLTKTFEKNLTSTESIDLSQLLERETNALKSEDVASFYSGKIILVTGAGGSIGKELVRQLLSIQPKQLILLDASEFNLYNLIQEFTPLALNTLLTPCLASVQDRSKMNELFSNYCPQVVFHAAAYKHVPILENSAREAFLVNVIGTKVIFELCNKLGVEHFVLISSDKAVCPTSVMGCSKRLAELLILTSDGENLNNQQISQRRTVCAAVRFGNVIDSSGSVIPLFKRQIANNEPLTITDPEMTRYFMSISEAVGLVLAVGTFDKPGKIYTLDMGPPVKILELAKRLCRVFHKPGHEIKTIGLRPGEKLHENLVNDFEYLSTTQNSKVFSVTCPEISRSMLEQSLRRLESVLDRCGNEMFSRLMFSAVYEADQKLTLKTTSLETSFQETLDPLPKIALG